MLVRMLATFAPSNCSTACLISILLAPGATWKTMVRPSSRRMDVFSVISGRRMTSVTLMTTSGERLLQLLQRVPGRDDALGVHDVPRGDATAGHQVDAGEIAHRPRQVLVGRHVDEDCLAVDAQLLQHGRGRLGLDLARRQGVDDHEPPVAELLRQGCAQRAALDLLRQRVLVAPRPGTEHGAALPPERGADVAHAGAAGPLLPPRLPAAAADERAVLRHVGPAPIGGVGPDHRLPDEVAVDTSPEHIVADIDGADLLVAVVDD